MQFWSFQNEWNMANIFNCTQKFMEEIHTYLHFLKEIVLKMPQHSISLPLKHNPLICYFEEAFSTQKRYEIKESVGNKRGN